MAFTEAEKRRIAALWMRASCVQETFAAEHGVSPRVLRTWATKYAGGRRPEARARAVVEKAIADLRALLAGLDAEPEDLEGSLEVARAAALPNRPADEEPPEAAVPKPMPSSGFLF